jgi:NAD(P)-dependent dehydrogenase (short-subunit alcohol dehydrogenase family)
VSRSDSKRGHLQVVRPDQGPPAVPTYRALHFREMFNLRGKMALVVGGGGGIGGAIAHAFRDSLAHVAIADINLEAAKRVAESCSRPLGDIKFMKVPYRQIDITDPDNVKAVVAEIEAELGRIDILVNSAGINIRRDVIDYTPEEWFKIINTNLSGVFFVTQAVAKGMLARGYGRVINLGSVSSLMGHPQHAPYAATKGGIAIMTKAMATEWATRGVTVNAIGPAYTVTGLITELMNDPEKHQGIIETIPMGRLGTPEDIVGAAVYLASDAASFVTGQTIYVDGGRTAD